MKENGSCLEVIQHVLEAGQVVDGVAAAVAPPQEDGDRGVQTRSEANWGAGGGGKEVRAEGKKKKKHDGRERATGARDEESQRTTGFLAEMPAHGGGHKEDDPWQTRERERG